MDIQGGGADHAGWRFQRRLCVVLFVVSLMFWGLIFSRSILALDDMSLIVRGQNLLSLRDISDMFRQDVVTQNGRIADGTLSLVAGFGEPAARVYFALASTLLFPTALIWLIHLTPRSARAALPVYAVPMAAVTLPFLMLALDRRLIGQLVLFGAASSGYFTGLFLVSLGLVPVLRAVNGLAVSRITFSLSALPLLVGVMFHEVLAAALLGGVLGVAYVAARRPERRRGLVAPAALMVVAVAIKAATPGLWSRAADADQRQFSDASLLARADLSIAFAVVAFIPLVAYVAGSVALSLVDRGVTVRRLTLMGMAGAGLVVVGFGYRVIDGYPISGVVTVTAVAVAAVAVVALRGAQAEPAELVACGAMVMALGVPVYGGLLPGRGWFFGEFIALLLATASLARVVAALPERRGSSRIPGVQFFAVALLGSGAVVAPVLAYELLDKVNDNHAWRSFVAAEVAGQSDGTVEIPWTYPWNDMRPSFALDDDHESYEGLTRAYFGIADDVELVWNGSIDWAAD